MKKRIVISGILTITLAVLSTGCGLFESSSADEKDRYYRDVKKHPTDGNGTDANNANRAGEADLARGERAGFDGANQPGQYTDGSGLNTYDGFGTPIPGVTFNPVYFGFDQFAIGASEQSKIDEVVAYLNKNPGTGVVIEGNCDNRGTEEYNRALGERRALAAQEQILAAGIASNRIKTISNGKSKLAAQGTDEDSHRLNRRDEFIAVKLMK